MTMLILLLKMSTQVLSVPFSTPFWYRMAHFGPLLQRLQNRYMSLVQSGAYLISGETAILDTKCSDGVILCWRWVWRLTAPWDDPLSITTIHAGYLHHESQSVQRQQINTEEIQRFWNDGNQWKQCTYPKQQMLRNWSFARKGFTKMHCFNSAIFWLKLIPVIPLAWKANLLCNFYWRQTSEHASW